MSTAIVWLRRDIRLADNPALHAAAAACDRIVPLWIDETPLDADGSGGVGHGAAPPHLPGEASRVWAHHALQALSDALAGQAFDPSTGAIGQPA